MIAEVVSIGDELTTGQRLDTNSQWLATRLGELGLKVLYHTTVADELDANVRALRQAVERADVVVASGGLGPTADDLTREALAGVAGVELVLDQPSLDHIRALFARRARPMAPSNNVQAMFPNGSTPIPNPHGTAPGIAIWVPRPGRPDCRIYALPGVPAEMKEMWPWVEGHLREGGLAGQIIRHWRIKCFGTGESDLEAMLPDLIRRGRDPSVGITVSDATITLRITAAGATERECYARMAPTIDTIRQCLGTLVFGEEEDELEHAVSRLLARLDARLSAAEWGTGGRIAHWFRDDPRCAEFFGGGVVVSDAQSAARLLNLDADALTAGADSATFVRAMALGLKRKLDAEYTLAVGRFPEMPGPGTAVAVPEVPPEVHFALATPHDVLARSARYGGHPAILKVRAAKQALDMVRLYLQSQITSPQGTQMA
jgi:nicotinamide-nucleotide amidase